MQLHCPCNWNELFILATSLTFSCLISFLNTCVCVVTLSWTSINFGGSTNLYTVALLFCMGALCLRYFLYVCVCVWNIWISFPAWWRWPNQLIKCLFYFHILSYWMIMLIIRLSGTTHKGIWYWSKEMQKMYGTVGDRVVLVQMATEDHRIPVQTTTVSFLT